MNEPKYQQGDIVYIRDAGCVYSTYTGAFKHFGMSLSYKNKGSVYTVPPLHEKENWLIQNIAIHENFYDILYCIYSPRHHCQLVIGEGGIRKNPIPKVTRISTEIKKNRKYLPICKIKSLAY